jgi:antitoxin ParD1/3/4
LGWLKFGCKFSSKWLSFGCHSTSGLYGSASEVIREALRLFEAYQSVQQSSIAALKADIELGMADVRAGRVEKMDMSSIKAKGRSLKKST